MLTSVQGAWRRGFFRSTSRRDASRCTCLSSDSIDRTASQGTRSETKRDSCVYSCFAPPHSSPLWWAWFDPAPKSPSSLKSRKSLPRSRRDYLSSHHWGLDLRCYAYNNPHSIRRSDSFRSDAIGIVVLCSWIRMWVRTMVFHIWRSLRIHSDDSMKLLLQASVMVVLPFLMARLGRSILKGGSFVNHPTQSLLYFDVLSHRVIKGLRGMVDNSVAIHKDIFSVKGENNNNHKQNKQNKHNGTSTQKTKTNQSQQPKKRSNRTSWSGRPLVAPSQSNSYQEVLIRRTLCADTSGKRLVLNK